MGVLRKIFDTFPNPIRAGFRARAAFRTWNLTRKGSEMLQGKKTYLGIIIAGIGVVLGWAGIGGEQEATELVTHGAEIVGLLIAMYGRWAAKP